MSNREANELMTATEVAQILHITPMKVKCGILNGTMPIGTVVSEGKNDRTVIIRKRFDAWMNAHDLKKEEKIVIVGKDLKGNIYEVPDNKVAQVIAEILVKLGLMEDDR